MRSHDDMLPGLIRSLEGSAREIDQTFADAGRQLGHGLSLFEALKQRLSTLSDELGGSELSEAGAALAGLAGQLRALNGGLSGETSALTALATHSHDASQALERLIDHMRLITILARGARIEAVSVRTSEHDFGDFTNEIVTLTTQAQRTIQACARDHDGLNALLDAALAAQRDFQSRYGAVLSALAGKLEQTLAEVAARQQQSLRLTGDAALRSGRIAAAAGGAIIALQSGDSIRQRLEHAIMALRLAGTIGSDGGAATGLDGDALPAAIQVLGRLQAAQLRESAATLAADAEDIEAALGLLAGDTSGLLDLVGGLYRGDGGASTSFLQKLESELAQASDLLGRCDRARSGVDRVTAALGGVLDTCQQTVAALSDTVSSIVLIGMNAGLRAARLGGGGRSLVVIAQELKLAADQVATDARRLNPTFVQMQQASARLTQNGRLDAGHFAELDRAMKTSLDAMRQTGERLGLALEQLTRDGSGFGAVVANARLAFSNAGATSDLIASVADRLAGSVPASFAPEPAAADRVRRMLQERIWPSYTMVAERSIHLTVLAALGLDGGAELPAATVPDAAVVDAFIF